MFEKIYKNKKVFVTGHTGFKGSWLVLWLLELGAKVYGYSLSLPSEPNHYDLLKMDIEAVFGEIRDAKKLKQSLVNFRPDIVFHLAAQPLVRRSYLDPVGTFETNIIGTVNLFEACRATDSVKAIVNITSDKCYENREWLWPYRENDPLGGHDPYSASKGCAELITTSYCRSFFPIAQYQKKHQTLIASARAGNVIGGGDWGENRLVPDIMRAASVQKKAVIRNPHSVRPWQHVLESLAGYLLLGAGLFEGKKEFSGAWNFGPHEESHKNVLSVIKELQDNWNAIDFHISKIQDKLHEAGLLKLDCSKARHELGWRPVWGSSRTFAKTVSWYREFYGSGLCLSTSQLSEYIKNVQQKQMYQAR